MITRIVTLDLTEAFDTVCHESLLMKLEHYGIRGMQVSIILSHKQPSICFL